ncbi:myeloperoxidase, thyroid peroxidase, cyclooxygenase catalytic domain-containing protein [Halorubrum coriense DSM 10284]|uniref:Myeloperoxidase, thyroid peroxidase, cyclooxygenase catalytic domain-containing protein n=1 Tax=Halorubrum coriense DSM 10284 TaxID=1227466 RepID=M0EE38_9EURY|nr:peroxidase family protein [Halorubrum coriense]ELZ45990.1 myeloperoxidase, thyroid peroxidase, cyclooxygenase catalytic domain-containing protein [Halorubrum coriense DSM 10284]
MGVTDKITCRVVDDDSRPLAGRIVIGERRDGDRIGHWTTGADGDFVLEADGGTALDDVSFTVRNPAQGGTEEPVRRRKRPDESEATLRLTVNARDIVLHGGSGHRGMNDAACTTAGPVRSHRFYTQFPELDPYDRDEELLRTLGGTGGEVGAPMMETPDDPVGDAETPAGYGIFGQFVDHDITFDPTSDIDRRNDPAALRNFRTPALDLDSLYRTNAETAPFLYDHDADERKLLTGEAAPPEGDDGGVFGPPGTDLQRNEQDTAVIGDPRNDENVVVSQLQLAFANFHSRIVDHLLGPGSSLVEEDESVLEAAQRLVRWHYQWVVRHDLLPRICDRYVLADIEEHGRQFFLPPGHTPAIPVEFGGAAYRFGHSMIPHAFDVNDGVGEVPLFPTGSEAEEQHLRGGGPVSSDLVVDWSRLLDTGDGNYQPSRKIEPLLAPALFELPVSGDRSLAVRNLRRGKALGLASGQDVAARMGYDPIRNEAFGDESPIMRTLRAHGRGADPDAPLWYYVLAEADYQQDGERLGAVGSRIVAETLIGLIEADETAYPNAAPDGWEPSLPQPTPTDGYTLADITAFAAEARPDGLVIDTIDAGPGSGAADGAGDPLDESVRLRNAAAEPIDLTGYVIDFDGQRDDLPGATLAPDETLTVHVGSGTDTAADHYLGREAPVLDDGGEVVTLYDPDGERTTRRRYVG